jgi:hypothetical protein
MLEAVFVAEGEKTLEGEQKPRRATVVSKRVTLDAHKAASGGD